MVSGGRSERALDRHRVGGDGFRARYQSGAYDMYAVERAPGGGEAEWHHGNSASAHENVR